MASYRKKKGSRNWYYRYVDENGDQHEKAGSPDRRETELLAAAVEREVARIKAGVYSAEELERKKRRDIPAAKAIDEFIATKTSITKQSKGELESYLRRFTAAKKVQYLRDITPRVIEQFFADKAGEYEGGATITKWWASVVSFLNWCQRRELIERIPTDMVDAPPRWTGRADRRRRALTDYEFNRIIGAIESVTSRHRMPNPDWAWMVRLARFTGLRRKELVSLSKSSFRGLDSENPFILCAAGDTKNGDEARQPIPKFLIPGLADWLQDRGPSRVIFHTVHDSAERLRADMARAGVEFMTDEGRIDFHSLRVTFVTWLVRSGANMKVAQSLARHGDPKLTFNTYAKLNMSDLRDAIEGASLPYQSPTIRCDTLVRRTVVCESLGEFDGVPVGSDAKISGQNASEQEGEPSPRCRGRKNADILSSTALTKQPHIASLILPSPDLEELVGIWNSLKPASRKALLAAARRLGRKS